MSGKKDFLKDIESSVVVHFTNNEDVVFSGWFGGVKLSDYENMPIQMY